MIEIKGSVVGDAIKAVKLRHGEQTLKAIVELLTGETRELFERGPILPTAWYPLDAFLQFLEMDIKVAAQGDEQALIRWSEALVERQLASMYQMFVKDGEPEYVLERLGIIHQTYYRGVGIDITFPQSGQAIIKYTGFAKQHRLAGLTLIGFYRKALELSGATNVQTKYKTAIEEGKGYCELMLSWDSK